MSGHRHHIAPNWSLVDNPGTKRSEFSDYGCMIFGYPSRGGIIVREHADRVELLYLGFDPLNPPTDKHVDQKAEDRFCDALTKIGGKYWSSYRRWKDVYFRDGYNKKPTKDELVVLFLGWTDAVHYSEGGNGGLLVLEYEDKDDLADGIGRLRMAVNMQERCQMMRDRFEPQFFEVASQYPGFHLNAR
ncbi:hypothetical protein LX32DRAFT_136913 [Colletotrichum zoysiae]|uniref:Uncharacterized protein n=1 Tax=Colletotrichum zoysiae TaxID=1216348 RepID=A0AAD9HPG1_9PEZI|nr:hypothetical protein LX32DRAFT_136913 [Colletotrichum zoysiae]